MKYPKCSMDLLIFETSFEWIEWIILGIGANISYIITKLRLDKLLQMLQLVMQYPLRTEFTHQKATFTHQMQEIANIPMVISKLTVIRKERVMSIAETKTITKQLYIPRCMTLAQWETYGPEAQKICDLINQDKSFNFIQLREDQTKFREMLAEKFPGMLIEN